MVVRVALLVCAVTLLGSDLCAQEAAQAAEPPTRPARPIAETVERLMRQPDFRLRIEVERPIELWVQPLLIRPEDTLQPRPRGSIYHQEYLRMTTPEAFRSSTLYPMGVGVDPGELVNGVRSMYRGWKEERIRQRVARELAEYLAAREAAQAATSAPAQ